MSYKRQGGDLWTINIFRVLMRSKHSGGIFGAIALDTPPVKDPIGQLVKLGSRKERGKSFPQKVEVDHDRTSKKWNP